MKVLIISHMYPSTFNPMAGIFVHEQVKALINNGCEVKVVSPVPWAPFPLQYLNKKWKLYSEIPNKAYLEGVEVYYPRYIEFPRGFLFHQSGKFMFNGIKDTIAEIYKEFKFDVIHSHVALPDGYSGMLANKEYKVPHVVTVHGQDFQQTLHKNEETKKALFKVLNSVDSIVVVSNKLKNIVKEFEFSSKITVVHNGISKKYIDSYSEKHTNKDYIEILSVSNLIPIKGLEFNIKAVSELVKKYPNLIYTIVGDGALRDELKDLVKELNIEKNVAFIGRVKHEKVFDYIKKCDIFSLPSYNEGFGVAYIEAMSQGKPIIGVKGQGIEDIIINGENGFLVNPKNNEEIYNILEILIKDKDKRNQVGQNARKYVEENLTWDINADKMINMYNNHLRVPKI
ncbi:glycosyltransferase [Clostridium peptidivorans]|uniref:glycosyltransferase n=1 Tax=Clostridium peptidivorans TaxID=100174 RepID=UPI000BE3376D|nr:glycosyltransferase [Clostridium peptidivorans]